MNKERRKKISEIISSLNEIYRRLESVKNDEEYAFDSMPEGLQYSMRGEESQEAIDSLDQSIDHIEEAISALEEII